jgi:hypothetical protein
LANDQPSDKTPQRLAMETKAKELNIDFRANIGDAKLLLKIKEVEPDYK